MFAGIVLFNGKLKYIFLTSFISVLAIWKYFIHQANKKVHGEQKLQYSKRPVGDTVYKLSSVGGDKQHEGRSYLKIHVY